MDKYEFKLKVDEMKALVNARNYKAAAEIAETINWRKIRNLNALVLAGEVFEQVERYEESKEILLMAYDKSPIGRNIIYRLAEIAIKTKNFSDAKDYYHEFVEIAPNDNLKYVLKYKMTAAQGLPYQEQIKILEELKEQEYSEEWAYELAYLYHRDGQPDKCVEACDELILWFGDGIYVEKALELKMQYQPLTKPQEEKYRLFRQKRTGVIEVKPEDFLESGEIVNKAMKIPSVVTTAEKYNTANLQNEIAKGLKQIIDASQQPDDSSPIDGSIKKLAEENPYLSEQLYQAGQGYQADQAANAGQGYRADQTANAGQGYQAGQIAGAGTSHTSAGYAELENQSKYPKNSLEQALKQGSKSKKKKGLSQTPQQDALDYGNQPGISKEPEKAISIQQIQDDWEKMKQSMENVANETDGKKKETAKRKALQQAQDLVERLNEMIPQLVAGMLPDEFVGFENQNSLEVQDNIDQATRIVANMNMLLQEQIDYLMAGNDTAQLIHKISDPTQELPELPEEFLEHPIETEKNSHTKLDEQINKLAGQVQKPALQRDQTTLKKESEIGIERKFSGISEEQADIEAEWKFMEGLEGKTDMDTGQKFMEKPENNMNTGARQEKQTTEKPEQAALGTTLRGTRVSAKKIRISLSNKPEFKTQEQLRADASHLKEQADIAHPETKQQISTGDSPVTQQTPSNGQERSKAGQRLKPVQRRGQANKPVQDDAQSQQLQAKQDAPADEPVSTAQGQTASHIPGQATKLSRQEGTAGEMQQQTDVTSQPARQEGTAGEMQRQTDATSRPARQEGTADKPEQQAGATSQPVRQEGIANKPERQADATSQPARQTCKKIPVEEPEEFSEEDMAAAAYEGGFYEGAPRQEKPVAQKPVAESPLEEEDYKKLTPEQQEVFSYFVPISGMEAQIYDLLQGVSRHLKWDQNSFSGNIIIEGIGGSGKTVLIMDIIKVLQKECQRPNGKIGKIDANALNQKDIDVLMEKISGGCLIIESAGKISRETAVKLSAYMEKTHSATLFILEDTEEGIQKALERDSSFASKFTEKISIPIFTTDDLVSFGKAYANDLDYDIDEMGILALYKRINGIQKLDHATTLTEVKEIVDEAIDRAESGPLKKVFGILTATRYNDDNLVILREKDFEE